MLTKALKDAMNERLYPAGHLDNTSPFIDCPCGWRGPAGLPHCDRCTAEKGLVDGEGRHHVPSWKHEGQCKTGDCRNQARDYAKPGRKPRWGLFCPEHEPFPETIEAAVVSVLKHKAPEFVAASAELAALMPQPEPPTVYEHRPFTVGVLDRTEIESSSRPGVMYPMARMVGHGWCHLTADCQGWNERGHCRHCDELNRRTAGETK